MVVVRWVWGGEVCRLSFNLCPITYFLSYSVWSAKQIGGCGEVCVGVGVGVGRWVWGVGCGCGEVDVGVGRWMWAGSVVGGCG